MITTATKIVKSDTKIDTVSTVNDKRGHDIGEIGLTSRFALINKLIMRDMNKNTTSEKFYKYTKDEIARFLKDPSKNEKKLRDAVKYIYSASSHFRRLIEYFVGLSDLAYIVSPYKIDPRKTSTNKTNLNYRRVLDVMSSMNPRTQFVKILKGCFLYDTFYGTMWVMPDGITIQQLPNDYCAISTVEGNVPNVTFDFSYFSGKDESYFSFFPPEFKIRFDAYSKNSSLRWQELDCPTSFAIKANIDSLTYSVPPFAGVLREIFDLEDYKELKLTKEAIENYAMIFMKLPLNDDGTYAIDYDKARDFWYNLDSVLPEEIGSVLTPMDMDKISFERTHTGDIDSVADAEQNLFTAAGVSSLLFNNDKASANALLLSIKADQAITFGIVKSIEDMVNRYIQWQSYGRNWKVTFLDVSSFNRKEMGDQYLKAAQYGLPTISMYAASQGLGQAEMECMNFLERDVLDLPSRLMPLQSSATQSSSAVDADKNPDGGRPTVDDGELTDSGEQTREDSDDWG